MEEAGEAENQCTEEVPGDTEEKEDSEAAIGEEISVVEEAQEEPDEVDAPQDVPDREHDQVENDGTDETSADVADEEEEDEDEQYEDDGLSSEERDKIKHGSKASILRKAFMASQL